MFNNGLYGKKIKPTAILREVQEHWGEGVATHGVIHMSDRKAEIFYVTGV